MMELKSYEKPWFPALKGILLIAFGLLGIIQIIGSIHTLAILFGVLIGAMAALLIGSGILLKDSEYRIWSVIAGVIHLAFCVFLLLSLEGSRDVLIRIILLWVLFYAITEMVEAGKLVIAKNAFFALFVMNGLLSLLFGYFLHVVIENMTAQGVFYVGVIGLFFGIANILSSYLLSKAPKA